MIERNEVRKVSEPTRKRWQFWEKQGNAIMISFRH